MRYTISVSVASLLGATLLTTEAALAEVPRVVTDIPPVHAMVALVMGDLGAPELLLDKGASEHSFQMRPSQAAGLTEADLVVWIGPELTPWLERGLEAVPADVARLELLDVPGTVTAAYGEGEGHDHAEEAGHDHAEEGHAEGEAHAEGGGHDHAAEGDHGHDHTGVDPHAWLDPANAGIWMTAIAAELGRIDPANAATYAANATAATDGIMAVDVEVAALLEPVSDKPIIVFHEAFGYFERHYGLTIAGSIAEGDAAAPGAARIAALRAMVTEGSVVCVFPEVQHDPALVEQMVEGTGARIGAPLDPVGSSLEPGPGMYAALLTGMATAIADCAGGA
jgi:zinc transport system substrate-binding protein